MSILREVGIQSLSERLLNGQRHEFERGGPQRRRPLRGWGLAWAGLEPSRCVGSYSRGSMVSEEKHGRIDPSSRCGIGNTQKLGSHMIVSVNERFGLGYAV